MIKVHLTFLSGELEGKSFQIDDETSIGREESNTIRVSDPLVSSRHCVICYQNERPFIRDLDSTNGTEVNGHAVREVELRDGDMILIGETRTSVKIVLAEFRPEPEAEPEPAGPVSRGSVSQDEEISVSSPHRLEYKPEQPPRPALPKVRIPRITVPKIRRLGIELRKTVIPKLIIVKSFILRTVIAKLMHCRCLVLESTITGWLALNRLIREVVLPKLVIPKAARRNFYRISAVAVLLLACIILLWFWWRAGNFETEIAVKQKFTLPPDIRPVQKLSIEAPQGKIRFPSFLILRFQEGDSMSQQITPLSRWQDGSIRWFQLRLAGRNRNDEKILLKTAFWSYLAQCAETVAGFVPSLFSANTTQVKVRKSCRVIRINTGVMKVEINPRKSCLFSKVWLDKNKNGWFSRDELVYNSSGNELLIETVKHDNKTGKNTNQLYTVTTPPEAVIEDSGPLHVCIRLNGTHSGEGEDGNEIEFPYTARIHCYAGLPLIEVFYTFSHKINKGKEQARTGVERLTIMMGLGGGAEGNVIFGLPEGKIQESLAASEELKLRQESDYSFKIVRKDRQGELTQIEEGFRSSGWLNISNAALDMTVFLDNFWQEYPSELSATEDLLKIDMYPGQMETPLNLAQGQAKTGRLVFYFHGEKEKEPESILELARVLDEPAGMPAGSYTGLTRANVERFPSYERGFDDAFDRYDTCLEEYGLMNYGDWYMGGQYGTDSWGNLEYDGPHAFAQQYLRTGHRKYLHQVKISARHLMDVDIIHYQQDSARIGAPHTHGKWHTQQGSTLGHIWVEGILDYYHLFGDRRALETAELVGDYLLRVAQKNDKPEKYYSERCIGWPLIALMALYEETGKEKYLEGARRMVELFLPFQNEEGYFPTKSTRKDKKGDGMYEA